MPNVCSLCRELATLRCSICQSELYCSILCQSEAWTIHRRICKLTPCRLATQADLTTVEAEIMLEVYNSCDCCRKHEGEKRLSCIADCSTAEEAQAFFTNDEVQPEGRNSALVRARAKFLNDSAIHSLARLRPFIKEKRLSPFYGIALIEYKAYSNDLASDIPHLGKLILREFFTYFTIVEVVKDLKRSMMCRSNSIGKLTVLMERLMKGKKLGWITLYMSFQTLQLVHTGFHNFFIGRIDQFDCDLLIRNFDAPRCYEYEERIMESGVGTGMVKCIINDRSHVEQ